MTALVKPPLALKKRTLSKTQLKLSNFIVGQVGEDRAATFLLRHGYHIWDRNVMLGPNELDIVAFDPTFQEVVFIEVKTRRYEQFETAAASVNFRKQRAWHRAAIAYLATKTLSYPFRFEVMMVYPQRILLIQS